MSLLRYANTDEQENALSNLIEWAKNANFKISYGTSIGKSPQSIVIDHKYQDGMIYVNRDGDIKIDGEIVSNEDDFIEAIKK